MKVFISWSKPTSQIIAEGLFNWLPKVIQAVEPFYSSNIEKGTKGIEEINKNLEGTDFGIVCLTRDDLESNWIHYEVGALSKIQGARIWTLLFNLKHSDVVQPLAQFQHTLAVKEDIYKLLESINKGLGEKRLEKGFLQESFEKWWSEFENVLLTAKKYKQIRIAIQAIDRVKPISKEAAQYELEAVKRDLSQAEKLFGQGLYSKTDIERATKEVEKAKNRYDTSVINIADAGIFGIEQENQVLLEDFSEKLINSSFVFDVPPTKISIKVFGKGTYKVFVWAS